MKQKSFKPGTHQETYVFITNLSNVVFKTVQIFREHDHITAKFIKFFLTYFNTFLIW